MNVISDLLAKCRFPNKDELHCAVSGGADSLALLVLATHTGKRVIAYHVDHGLRQGSADEFRVVQHVCEQFGARSHSLHIDLADGPNLEARARAARYKVLPEGVLTGHTADDQAETLVINLLRGAGIDGLGAMRPETRPIVFLRRSETMAVCKHFGLTPVVDPSNSDPMFLRNRVRAELLPLMSSIASRDVVHLFSRQASHMRDDTDVLLELAAQLDPTDARTLRNARPALVRRALREWLRDAGGDERHPPSQKAIERVMNVIAGDATACDIADGYEVRRHAQRLFLRRMDEDMPTTDSHSES